MFTMYYDSSHLSAVFFKLIMVNLIHFSALQHTVRNSGLVLWVQQFCALFLKRVYNTIRFWQAVISQLILPLIFVLLALILAVILPNANENDPVRQLRIDNSGRDPNRRIVFYAEFGDAPRGVFNFGVSLVESTQCTV